MFCMCPFPSFLSYFVQIFISLLYIFVRFSMSKQLYPNQHPPSLCTHPPSSVCCSSFPLFSTIMSSLPCPSFSTRTPHSLPSSTSVTSEDEQPSVDVEGDSGKRERDERNMEEKESKLKEIEDSKDNIQWIFAARARYWGDREGMSQSTLK